MSSGLGPPPGLVHGYGWQRPPEGRLAHVVPTGEAYTLCGLVTSLTKMPWSVVLGADLINGIGWCPSCGEHVRKLTASAAVDRVLIAGRRSPAEVRRVLAALDGRMAQSKKDLLAELDRRMSTTSRRGAGPTGVVPLGSRKSGHGATPAAPRPRPPNQQRIHDPLASCVACKTQAPGYPNVALVAGGVPANYDGHPWFGTELDYHKWVRSRTPRRRQAR
jgi:hypothetical protein